MTTPLVLVINCGSSSIKFALVDEDSSEFPLEGLAERLNSPEAVLRWEQDGEQQEEPLADADHRQALEALLPRVQAYAGDRL
ncbi:MAG TPA: propionate/acetate kinase, partial [Alcanivorax sp.]|nr:propionate/acetate kinase [Alcanivorax sp.]